ncbi:hypothetical protein XENTR_v10013873 [Xenopus tropicalis]|nr:hypothetical protein XENTR_v10013873 [Xenopus tropicalis]
MRKRCVISQITRMRSEFRLFDDAADHVMSGASFLTLEAAPAPPLQPIKIVHRALLRQRANFKCNVTCFPHCSHSTSCIARCYGNAKMLKVQYLAPVASAGTVQWMGAFE